MRKIIVSVVAAFAAVVILSDLEDNVRASQPQELSLFFPSIIFSEDNAEEDGLTVVDGSEIEISFKIADIFRSLFS